MEQLRKGHGKVRRKKGKSRGQKSEVGCQWRGRQTSEVSGQRSESAKKVIEFVVGADPDPLDDITLAMTDCSNV